jgi:4-hydroxy-tetrahydrodipicolinate synthase
MIDWSGIFHVVATPFTEDGALDTAGLPRLVECALATGVNGLTILGIAGEAHRLTDEERRRVVEAVVKETAGRVPVVVGVSASGTHLATALAAMAREQGASAVMVAPPAGVKNPESVAEYYRAVATAGLPLVIQDEPVTTQVTMPAAFLARLCAELPSVQALKLEEAPTLPKITALRRLLGRPIAIFGGLGGVYFLEELARGAAGAMTGFPYPEALRHPGSRGRRPARRRPLALLPLAPPHPLREPARRRAGHRARHPQGDSAEARVDPHRVCAAPHARARCRHARRDHGPARRDGRPVLGALAGSAVISGARIL